MKKLLWLVLALILALGLMAAGTAETALPAAGDTVNGFTVTEIREFPLIDAQLVLFEHEKTGAKLLYIANDDTNRVFDLTFATRTIDNTGLPHVFEHATLGGSKKYPSKSLFFNLSYQTYNTYMNASTYPMMTTYPVASLSEAQLLKLADFYTDSCFNPMIMWDESIFNEEAWRYRLMGEDEPLTIEGTVYSEMQGANTLARMASLYSMRDAFPGSICGNDSGGLPDDIPSMTWEAVKNYHDTYYHPSNCIAYLYGEYEDYTAFLALLDEYFSAFERKEFSFADEAYTPIAEPVKETHAYGVEASSPVEHVSSIYYTLVVPGATEEQKLTLNTMTDLLLADSSALNQAIKSALPHAIFSCYVQTTTPDFAVIFSLAQADEADAEVFKGLVDEALADVAANGFPQELVDSTMASLATEIKLLRESATVGVDSIVPNMAYDYMTSGDVFDYVNYVDALGKLNDWNQEGRYAKAAADCLVGSQTYALSVTYPVPGMKEEHDQQLKEKLAEIKAAMSPEEIAALIESSNAAEEETDADTAAMITSLQAVDVTTLPEEFKIYEVKETAGENGVRNLRTAAGVDGIGQADILLDAAGVTVEGLMYARLLVASVPYMNTKAHTRAELASLSERYLYNRNIRLSFFEEGDAFHVYMRLGWIAPDEDLAAGYDLMYELVFDMDLDDPEAMLAAVQALKPELRSSINSQPYMQLLQRSMAVTDPLTRAFYYVNGLPYYAFLEEAEAQLSSDPAAFMENMKRVREQLRSSANAITMYAGSEESMAVNDPLADAFLAKLSTEAHAPVSYEALPVPATREGLVVDSSVQYNNLSLDLKALGVEYTADMDAVTSVVADAYLFPLLRDQYGAYSVFHGFSESYGFFTVTYRDPNVKETFAVYDQLADLIASAEIDQETLNGYILSAYSSYAMPQGELSGAVAAELDHIEGKDQSRYIDWMRELKSVTPEKVKESAELYRKLAQTGNRSTAGGAAVIEENADLYDAVLNPFGTVDSSKVELTDVSADHPQYEAVRFAFEEGLMSAQDGVFGVDEKATIGDLAKALYVFAAGESTDDAAGAAALLSQYGLVPADADIAGELTEQQAVESLNTLATLFGAPGFLSADAPETVYSRGNLAEILKAFNDTLEQMFAAQ